MVQKKNKSKSKKSKAKIKAKPKNNKLKQSSQSQTQNVTINIPNTKSQKSSTKKSTKKERPQNQSVESSGYYPHVQYINHDNREADTLRGELVDTKNKLLTYQKNQSTINDNIDNEKKALFNNFMTLQNNQKSISDTIDNAKKYFSLGGSKGGEFYKPPIRQIIPKTKESNEPAARIGYTEPKLRRKDMTDEQRREHDNAIKRASAKKRRELKKENAGMKKQVNDKLEVAKIAKQLQIDQLFETSQENNPAFTGNGDSDNEIVQLMTSKYKKASTKSKTPEKDDTPVLHAKEEPKAKTYKTPKKDDTPVLHAKEEPKAKTTKAPKKDDTPVLHVKEESKAEVITPKIPKPKKTDEEKREEKNRRQREYTARKKALKVAGGQASDENDDSNDDIAKNIIDDFE